MADINRVVLVGRLVRDAELKYTNNGSAVCKFSVAVNRRKKEGEAWVEEANFFDVVLWGKTGEAVNQYLTKGKQVGVEGELRQDRWEQDGQNRSRVEIFASNIQLLGSPSGSGGGYSGGERGSGERGSGERVSGERGGGERSGADARKNDVREEGEKGGAAPRPADDFNDDIPF